MAVWISGTIERLGPLGCTGCPVSTCGLST